MYVGATNKSDQKYFLLACSSHRRYTGMQNIALIFFLNKIAIGSNLLGFSKHDKMLSSLLWEVKIEPLLSAYDTKAPNRRYS